MSVSAPPRAHITKITTRGVYYGVNIPVGPSRARFGCFWTKCPVLAHKWVGGKSVLIHAISCLTASTPQAATTSAGFKLRFFSGVSDLQRPGVQPRPIRSLQTAPRRVWPFGQIIIRELGTSAFKRRAARHRRVVGILNDQVRSSGVTRLQDRTFNRGPVYLIQKTNLYVNWGYTATPGHLCG